MENIEYEGRYFETIDSTQLYCRREYKNLLKDSNHVVVRAGRQTSGIGRGSHEWNSDEGNIFATFCSKFPKKECAEYTRDRRISLIVSTTVCKTLESFGFNPSIKFFNDVFLNEKKISGNMSDSRVFDENHTCLLIGIGINVNLVDFSGISQRATSMKEEGGGNTYKISDVFSELKRNLEKDLDRMRKYKFADLGKLMNQKLCFKGQMIDVLKCNGDEVLFSGILRGVDEECSIIVENEGKEIRKFSVGPFFSENMDGVFRIRRRSKVGHV